MTPYAYSISDYDSHNVFPTLDACAAFMKKEGYPPRYQYTETPVIAHHLDGSSTYTSVKDYVQPNDVNETEVAAYIDDLRAKSLENERQMTTERVKAGQPPIFVTGWQPIHYINRDSLIRDEISKRKYSWK